ncbi:MAG: hypothetical protein ACXVYB_00300 [Arthrobacter sp.]
MAITSIGYDGTVSEADWTKLIGWASMAAYGVIGRGDWKVTAHATLSLGVSIAAGDGWGQGVYDSSSSTVSLAGASISSGSRWDMVVARRNWSGVGGSTSFAMITGTSSQSLPTRNTNPGTLDDQPIALVQFSAGQSAATAIIDLRVWSGNGGGMYAASPLAKDYNNQVGSRLVINGDDWVSTINSSGNQAWVLQSTMNSIQLFDTGASLVGGNPANGTRFLVQSGTMTGTTDLAGYGRVTWPTAFPNGLLSVTAVTGDDWAAGAPMFIAGSGNPAHGTGAYGDKTSWVYALLGQDPSTKVLGKMPSKLHRINWTAIGW